MCFNVFSTIHFDSSAVVKNGKIVQSIMCLCVVACTSVAEINDLKKSSSLHSKKIQFTVNQTKHGQSLEGPDE